MISTCYYMRNNGQSRSQFCTWHDSSAVMSSAKWWSNWMNKIKIRTKLRLEQKDFGCELIVCEMNPCEWPWNSMQSLANWNWKVVKATASLSLTACRLSLTETKLWYTSSYIKCCQCDSVADECITSYLSDHRYTYSWFYKSNNITTGDISHLL